MLSLFCPHRSNGNFKNDAWKPPEIRMVDTESTTGTQPVVVLLPVRLPKHMNVGDEFDSIRTFVTLSYLKTLESIFYDFHDFPDYSLVHKSPMSLI